MAGRCMPLQASDTSDVYIVTCLLMTSTVPGRQGTTGRTYRTTSYQGAVASSEGVAVAVGPPKLHSTLSNKHVRGTRSWSDLYSLARYVCSLDTHGLLRNQSLDNKHT